MAHLNIVSMIFYMVSWWDFYIELAVHKISRFQPITWTHYITLSSQNCGAIFIPQSRAICPTPGYDHWWNGSHTAPSSSVRCKRLIWHIESIELQDDKEQTAGNTYVTKELKRWKIVNICNVIKEKSKTSGKEWKEIIASTKKKICTTKDTQNILNLQRREFLENFNNICSNHWKLFLFVAWQRCLFFIELDFLPKYFVSGTCTDKSWCSVSSNIH